MPNPILEEIAAMIPEAEKRLEELREMISVSVAADEDRTSEKADMKMLELKLAKWKKALTDHGYKV